MRKSGVALGRGAWGGGGVEWWGDYGLGVGRLRVRFVVFGRGKAAWRFGERFRYARDVKGCDGESTDLSLQESFSSEEPAPIPTAKSQRMVKQGASCLFERTSARM